MAGVYVAPSSFSYYNDLFRDGSMYWFPILTLLSFILLLLAFFYYDLGIKKRSAGVLCLKTERDIWRCKICIRITCLVYIVVILSLNCILVFLSTAVQEVADTEQKHCKDIFNLASGDTSHKPLHQVAMELNLHCIDINVSDGLKCVVIYFILSVLVITLNTMLLLKCTENGTENYYILKLSVISIYIFIVIMHMLPSIAHSYSDYGVSSSVLNFFTYGMFVSLLLVVFVSV